jgi:hypothetical protein
VYRSDSNRRFLDYDSRPLRLFLVCVCSSDLVYIYIEAYVRFQRLVLSLYSGTTKAPSSWSPNCYFLSSFTSSLPGLHLLIISYHISTSVVTF